MKKINFSALVLFILVCSRLMAMEEDNVSFSSFNITADFFDKKEIDYKNHTWANRRKAVFETIKQKSPDVLALQELSPDQAFELTDIAGYKSFFLSQTPSQVEVGLIVEGKTVKEWIGKNVGTPLIGIFYKENKFEFIDKGRFWLKEEPDVLPVYTDRSETDKGFGNMNTYRATLWVHLKHLNSNKSVFAFNSHYPLSGGPQTRLKCAEMERKKINEIAQNNFWISMGDRNIIFELGTLAEVGDIGALKPLLENAYNAVSNNHYGPRATWAGFNYEPKCKNPIHEGSLKCPTAMDIIVSNHPSKRSEHVVTQFNAENEEIEFNPKVLKEDRNIASDHLMVIVDYRL
jgi:endonuclease/exonuclease/phosphatase family metal-dependent hydrolase